MSVQGTRDFGSDLSSVLFSSAWATFRTNCNTNTTPQLTFTLLFLRFCLLSYYPSSSFFSLTLRRCRTSARAAVRSDSRWTVSAASVVRKRKSHHPSQHVSYLCFSVLCYRSCHWFGACSVVFAHSEDPWVVDVVRKHMR